MDQQKPITLLCIGSSVTEGEGAEPIEQMSYPAQLANALGDRFQVINAGVGGTCMISEPPFNSYSNTAQFLNRSQYQPDIVTIMLGSNDAPDVGILPQPKEDFKYHCRNMITAYQTLPSSPRIILVFPQTSYHENNVTREYNMNHIVVPAITEVASELHLPIIDVKAATLNHPEWYQEDGLHLNNAGYTALAQVFYAFFKDWQPTL